MSKFNKSYRIRTNVGEDTQVHVNLDRDYDVLEIMSLKINQENAYKYHTSNYGVIAGRVLANDALGIPNAKVSVFINIDDNDINDVVKSVLYPYNTTSSKDKNGVRYNLLPNEQISNCHSVIGTFPEKQYMLDNDNILEVFEKYYKFTTRTNNSGDYMIFGVPTGAQTIHVDIDLSDIGILSQKPRDMVYKGYNIEQFENPNKFKERGRFVERMWRIAYFSCVEVLAYCVMSNHFHILVYVPHPIELNDEEVLSRENNRIARDILVILTKGPNRPAELRKELGVNSANYFTSRYLTPMLEDGFIEREKGVDKCSSQVRYMITSKGRKVVL